MIGKETIEKYPKSTQAYCQEQGLPLPMMDLIPFDRYVKHFDSQGLFIGITCDADGIFWIPEVCSVPLKVVKSREEAQQLVVEECFRMLEEMSEFEIK